MIHASKKLTTCLMVLALMSGGTMAQPAHQLPNMGDSASTVLNKQQEAVLGRQAMREVKRHLPLIEDPYLSYYLETIGQRLTSHSANPSWPFYFFLIKADTINAFALPGGYIGVHTGLILASNTESELAGVLSHEIAHVTQRHIARMYERASQLSLPTMAAFLGAIALATQNPAVGTGALTAAVAGGQQYAINFTRENEREADRIGVLTLSRAGFDPNGMPNFFEEMQKNARLNSLEYPVFLRTHPVNEERISDTRNSVSRLKSKHTYFQSGLYRLAKVRTDILTTTNRQESHYQYQAALKKSKEDISLRYGLALSSFLINKPKEAYSLIHPLAQEFPNQPLYTLLLASTEMKLGQSKEALKRLKQTYELYPTTYFIALAYDRALLEEEHPSEANLLLEKQIQIFKGNTKLYQLLAESASKIGKIWQAHFARAEILALQGDYDNAIHQLEMAIKATTPEQKYHLASLNARLQSIKKEFEVEKN